MVAQPWNPYKHSRGIPRRRRHPDEEEYMTTMDDPVSQTYEPEDVDMDRRQANEGFAYVDKTLPKTMPPLKYPLRQAWASMAAAAVPTASRSSPLFQTNNLHMMAHMPESIGIGAARNAFRMNNVVQNSGIQTLHSQTGRLRQDNILPQYSSGTGFGIPMQSVPRASTARLGSLKEIYKPTEMIGARGQLVEKRNVNMPDGSIVQTRRMMGFEPNGDFTQIVRNPNHRQSMRLFTGTAGREHPSDPRRAPTDGGKLPPIFDVQGTYRGERFHEVRNDLARFEHNIMNQHTMADLPQALAVGGRGMEGPTQHVQKELSYATARANGGPTAHAKQGWTLGTRTGVSQPLAAAMGHNRGTANTRVRSDPSNRYPRVRGFTAPTAQPPAQNLIQARANKGRATHQRPREQNPPVPAAPARVSSQPGSSKSRGRGDVTRQTIAPRVQQAQRYVLPDRQAHASRLAQPIVPVPQSMATTNRSWNTPEPRAHGTRLSVNSRSTYQAPVNVPRINASQSEGDHGRPRKVRVSIQARNPVAVPKVVTRARISQSDSQSHAPRANQPPRTRSLAYDKVSDIGNTGRPTAHPVNPIERVPAPPRLGARLQTRSITMATPVADDPVDPNSDAGHTARTVPRKVNTRFQHWNDDENHIFQQHVPGTVRVTTSPTNEARMSPLLNSHREFAETNEVTYA